MNQSSRVILGPLLLNRKWMFLSVSNNGGR
jgi:hypothetical protein